MKKIFTSLFLPGLFTILACVTVNAQIQRYVKVDGTGDGTSWSNASGNLQDMVDEVGQHPEKGTVHVAAGTYKGQTFNMRQGVHVYGGYPATGEGERNPFNNQTILDGENTRRVLYQSESDAQWTINTVWDGFYIQNGKASYGAGAVICLRGIIRNSVIRNNHATTENEGLGQGGGFMMKKVNASEQNRTGLLLNCIIVNNTADRQGAGVFFAGSSTGSIINCIIANNDSGQGSGGVHISSGSRWARVHNSIVWGNFGVAGYQLWTPAAGEKLEDKKNNIIEDGLAPDSYNPSCTDNVSENPLFVKPTTFTGIADTEARMQELMEADWQVKSGSPAIDTGITVNLVLATNEQEPFANWLPKDIVGNERIIGSAVDIGPFEFKAEDGDPTYLIAPDNIQWQVYPNPVINTLRVSGLEVGDRIRVMNIIGASLISMVAENETLYMDMAGLKKGIYLLSVERQGIKVVQKVVKN